MTLITTLSYAQPSDASVKALVKKQFPMATTIKLGGSHQEKKYENGAWVFYYTRNFSITSKTKYPGITFKHQGGVVYTKQGGSYKHKNYSTSESELLGVPNPDKEEIIALLTSDLEVFLETYHYNQIVGEISEIIIPEGNEYKWPSLETVSFLVQVTYTEKTSNTILEKAEHTYEIVMYSDEYKKPWKKFISAEDGYARKTISKTDFSTSEIDAMKTLSDIDEINKAKNALGKLPEVADAPKFESEKQLFYYLHDIAMNKDADTFKAHLMKNIATSCKRDEYLLKQYAEDWVNTVVDNLTIYKKTHCEYPKIKEEQYGQVVFYDKERSRNVTYVGTEEEGIWKVKFIRYYPAKSDDVMRMENSSGECGEKPNLEVQKEVKYEIGDIVDVAFSNGVFAAEINKKDPNFDNRYYVKLLEGGSGYWMTEDNMTPSAKKKETKKMGSVSHSENKTEESVDFKAGDAVGVKTRSGVMNGTVVKKVGSKYLIKLDDTGYEDMWVAKEHLVKR